MSELGSIAGGAQHHAATGPSALVRVAAYWSALRQDGRVPRRNEINPRDLGPALPDVFLAELVTPRVARLRICGHRIEDLMGMDMRGMPLSVLFAGPAREAISEAIEQAGMGARVTLSLQAAGRPGQRPLTATLALLPLADETGRITRLLGVLDQLGEIGRAPRSFTLADPALMVPDIAPVTPRPALRVIPGGRR